MTKKLHVKNQPISLQPKNLYSEIVDDRKFDNGGALCNVKHKTIMFCIIWIRKSSYFSMLSDEQPCSKHSVANQLNFTYLGEVNLLETNFFPSYYLGLWFLDTCTSCRFTIQLNQSLSWFRFHCRRICFKFIARKVSSILNGNTSREKLVLIVFNTVLFRTINYDQVGTSFSARQQKAMMICKLLSRS